MVKATAYIFGAIDRTHRDETTLKEKPIHILENLSVTGFGFYEQESENTKGKETGIQVRIAVIESTKEEIYRMTQKDNTTNEGRTITIQEEELCPTDKEILTRSLEERKKQKKLPNTDELKEESYSIITIKEKITFGAAMTAKRREEESVVYYTPDMTKGITIKRKEDRTSQPIQ